MLLTRLLRPLGARGAASPAGPTLAAAALLSAGRSCLQAPAAAGPSAATAHWLPAGSSNAWRGLSSSVPAAVKAAADGPGRGEEPVLADRYSQPLAESGAAEAETV